MSKKCFIYLVILFLSGTHYLPAQNYFDSLQTAMETLPAGQQLALISEIPFDKMSNDALGAALIYQKGIKLAGEQDPEALGLLYEKLSLAQYYHGDYDLSIESALLAIDQYEKQGNTKQMGSVYASLGYQMKRRNLPKAFEYMRKGLNFLLVSGDKKTINPAINNFGVLHEMNGNLDSALYYYNKSLNIVEELNDSIGIPYSLNNIAGAYVLLEKYEEALPFYERAYQIRLKRNDLNGLAENNTYYGDFYFKQQQFAEAIPFYQKAYTLCRQIKYNYLQKVNAEQLATCFQQEQQFDSTLFYLKKSVELNDQLLNESTLKTINNLEIQFETEKKEKLIAEHNTVIAKKELQFKQRTYLMYSIVAIVVILLVIGFFIIRHIRFKQQELIEENRLKDQITKGKVLAKLNEERLRISKDLHDNIGSQLTFIISSIDNLNYYLGEQQQNLAEKLQAINTYSREAIKELRATINELNKNR
ncbi:MAG: tetratricopeptide repeat protein [Flavobacteriales bacterium]|nr:tetratricopeptide repeat protein [Flavobacteriales bacterium]